MAEVKLRGLGLREVDFGDFDRYLTALTEDGRRIEILCKNARRGKKQNPAARQLCYSEFILSDRGGRYTLRDADLVLFRSGGHSRGRKVREAYRRLCTACGQYPAGNASCAYSRAAQGVCVRTQRTRQRAVLRHGRGVCEVPPRTRV